MSEQLTLVAAAVLVSDGAVLLARRPLGDPLAGHWELPGGKIEMGESPEECLARELAEECGIGAEVGTLFAESTYRYPHAFIRLLAYWITSWSGDIRLHAHDAYCWATPGQLDGPLIAPADLPLLAALREELT